MRRSTHPPTDRSSFDFPSNGITRAPVFVTGAPKKRVIKNAVVNVISYRVSLFEMVPTPSGLNETKFGPGFILAASLYPIFHLILTYNANSIILWLFIYNAHVVYGTTII